MVRLNFVGWLSLLAVLAAIGGATWAVTDRTWTGVLTTGFVLLLALVTDRVRWRNSWMSLGMESEASAQHLLRLLAAQKVKAEVESVRWDDEEQAVHSVKVRQRDRKVAEDALTQVR